MKFKARFIISTFVIAVLLALQALIWAQQGTPATRLSLPVLQATEAADLGIAFSNPTLDPATVTLTARTYDGGLIAGQDINNPATITLPARGQRALRTAEIFGSGIVGRNGWIEVTASSAAIKGFFLVFDSNLQYIDGSGLVETPSRRLVFPKVSGATTLSFANIGSQNFPRAALLLFDDSGRLVDRHGLNIAPFSGRSAALSDFFPNAVAFSGYALLESDSTPFGGGADALVGFETYRNRTDVAALTAVDHESGFRSGYLPHFVSQGGYYGAVGLVNTSRQAQRVRITAEALEVAGQTRTPASVTVERTVPGFGRFEERADQLFGFSGDAIITGYIRYEVQENGPGLIGYVEYGGTDGLLLSASRAQGSGLSDIYFSHVAEGGGFYTGLALLNPNAHPVSITVDAFDREGRRTGSTAVRLAPGLRRTRLFSELFPTLPQQSGGYIHVSSSRPIYAFQLFGSRTSLNILANVTAQGVALRPQGVGRSVTAANGANVLSNDGGAAVAIPPGALAVDTPVHVEALPIENLPVPGSGQRVIAAVEAGPGGTRFKIPVRLSFPIAVQMPPDTMLPLLLFNSQSKRYETTEFAAVVDETGRTATAEVTHFSTYATALPDAQLLNVTRIAPSSGLPGATLTLTGSGFGASPAAHVVTFAGADNTSLPGTVTAATADTLTVTVPAGAVTGYVTVRLGGRSSVGLVFNVPQDQPRPSISAITPAGAIFGAASVEIEVSGTGFRPSSTVTYDGTRVPFTFVDSTLVLLSMPGQQLKAGIGRFVVTNSAPGGGASNAIEFTVAYPRPAVTGITPNVVDFGDVAEVTVTGSNFTELSMVEVNGAPIRPVFVNATTLRLPLRGIEPGNYTVAVFNPAPGGGLSNATALRIAALIRTSAIQLLDPNSGAATREVVVNVGNSVRPEIRVIDNTGAARIDSALRFSSLAPDVATVDADGTVRGKKAGFSTFVVSDSDATATFTITVVEVDAGVAGIAVTGIAQDFARRLYLAATQDHTVLLLQDIKQAPSLWAGMTQSAGLKNDLRLDSLFRRPAFLTLDQAEGRLYVSDSANNAIRRVSPGNLGRVETVAEGFKSPQGLAIDSRGNLWVADSGNHTIRRVNLTSGAVETIAGQAGTPGSADGNGSSARFNFPVGLAVETETPTQALTRLRRGDPPPPVNLIVADSGNGAIRRVSESGQVDTLLVAGGSPSMREFGFRISECGFCETKSEIRNPQSAFSQDRILVAGSFNSPTGVAVDPLGNIYVTEATSGAVKTILNNGDVVLAVQPNTFAAPQGIAITETGRIVVAGSNRAAQEIRYGQPEITSITPARAANKGGVTVTVEGSNFAPGTVVLVGGVIMTGARIETTQRITFSAPALASGLTTLTVQNRGGIAQRSWIVEPEPLSGLAAGRVTTLAGGATFVGDGRSPATVASLLPWKAVVDVSGDLYISDNLHHRIRRISAASGVITTVAGTGDANFTGDGRLATAAALRSPQGIAVDREGNLYIADSGNNRIRKVTASTGIITTVAGDGKALFTGDGAAATSASLWVPSDVAVDSAGNLYIADNGNNRIRKVTASTSIITTVAGNGVTGYAGDGGQATGAAMNFPQGVAVDQTGNVYVADTFNAVIRRIGTNGIIQTVAGNGTSGFAGDGGQATSAQLRAPYGINVDAFGNLFIADTFNNRVRRVDAATGVISTIAGNGQTSFSGDNSAATAASLWFPTGVAIDAAQNVLIADNANLRVRRILSRTGVITTVAGNGNSGYFGDLDLATAAGFDFPAGIAFDGSGNWYVTDSDRIRKVTAATGVITTVAGGGSPADGLGDGGLATAAQVSGPAGVVADSAGNIFVAETRTHRVRKITAATGIISTVAGTGQAGLSGDDGAATSAALNVPSALALDAAGANLYVADRFNHRIRKVNLNTGVITTVAGTSGGYSGNGGLATLAKLNEPLGIALDSAGNLFIADYQNQAIRKITASTGFISTIAGAASGPEAGFEGDGNPAVNAKLRGPTAVALDSQNNLFIADTGNSRIRRIAVATSIITTVAGNGQTRFTEDNLEAQATSLSVPVSLAFDKNGNLVFADASFTSSLASRIRAIKGPLP